jgi:hypothetical protein
MASLCNALHDFINLCKLQFGIVRRTMVDDKEPLPPTRQRPNPSEGGPIGTCAYTAGQAATKNITCCFLTPQLLT